VERLKEFLASGDPSFFPQAERIQAIKDIFPSTAKFSDIKYLFPHRISEVRDHESVSVALYPASFNDFKMALESPITVGGDTIILVPC
jgi:hypothetical protein